MTRHLRHAAAVAAAVVSLAGVAGCTSGSDGNGSPSVVATATVTATGSASSANPPTGSGVPATSTPPAGGSPTGGATGSPTGGPTGSSTSSGPGLCTPTVMTFRLGAGGGAAGTDYYPIIATNASQQPCVTTGFPGVAMLNAAGRQIAQASRETGTASAPVTTIVVQPGQQISARLRSSTMGTNGALCAQSPALLFTLPDNTDSTRIVTGLPACADGVSVGAFVRGTTGMA